MSVLQKASEEALKSALVHDMPSFRTIATEACGDVFIKLVGKNEQVAIM